MYNHITDLKETSFFGEYQVLFDLKAGNYYKTAKNHTGISSYQTIIFKLSKKVFLNIIT